MTSRVFSSAFLILVFSLGLGVLRADNAKPKITKRDDLPRHTYRFKGKVTDLITSDKDFATLAAAIRADTEHDLATYDIEDKTTLKDLKSTLMLLDLLEGRNDEARTIIAELRALEDKPSLKYMTGFLTEVRLDSQKQAGTTDLTDPKFQEIFVANLTERGNALPWDVVQDELKHAKGGFEIRTKDLLLGQIDSELQPVVDQTGALSNDLAGAIIGVRYALLYHIPLKAPVLAGLNAVIDPHLKAAAEKKDIWKERDVTLTANDGGSPVVIGIWDSGVDPSVYPHQLFTNTSRYPWFALGVFTILFLWTLFVVRMPGREPAPLLLGLGLGVAGAAIAYVLLLITPLGRLIQEDPHGLAFDLHSNRTHGELYPLGAAASRYPELRAQIKGFLDIQASIDSPEASALKAKLGSLKQDQVKPFIEDLGLVGNYIHGTHVAGIASNGNPFAEILIARLTFDYHIMPEKPTVEDAQKGVVAYQTYIDYFKKHNVRVVNMSWGGDLAGVDDALEKNGVADPDVRKKLARELFEIDKNGLRDALASAPDILFVVAAGNSNNDVKFDEVIPSSLELPNMISVGAVDQAGDETSFTSFGKNVIAYADGFEVESPVPGGVKLKLSGTSMASPEVTNLAAKLFALDPTLKPADVIDLIKAGLTPNPANPRIQLLNPKKSIEALQNRKSGSNSAPK